MTSWVTGRMDKVRHNSLNQSDCLPPLRPPLTNNDAFVWGCTPLVCSQMHTHRPTWGILHILRWSQKELGEGEQHINTARVKVWVLSNNLAPCVFLSMLSTGLGTWLRSPPPPPPQSKPAPLLAVGERSHGVAFLSVWGNVWSDYYSELGGWGVWVGGGNLRSWTRCRAGYKKTETWGVQNIWERMFVCAHVCVQWNKPVHRKPWWLLSGFKYTAACLVWAALRDRHIRRRTGGHTSSCQHPYLWDRERKQTGRHYSAAP